jgi:Rhodopirellula transposase DDE domain
MTSPGDSAGKAIPCGVYDVTANAGWVNVGTDHDTAAFAVESIRRWWNACGSQDYPDARRLLITADAGGSNGYRTRAWKAELAALAAETGLESDGRAVVQFDHCPMDRQLDYRVAEPSARVVGHLVAGQVEGRPVEVLRLAWVLLQGEGSKAHLEVGH